MNNSGRSRKYARMLNHVKAPISWEKKQLIHQKRADFIKEWKAAEKSNTEIAPVGSLEKLMEIEDELDHMTQNTLYNSRKSEEEYKDKLWEEEMEKRDNKILRRLYKQRSEIIEEIPKFWSTAFKSDYGLQIRLNDVDKKIVEFLDSVVVEDCLKDKSYDIALNFDENPYFENSSLTTKWSYSHHNGWVHESGTNINGQPCTDVHTSFFTLFCDPLIEDVSAKLQVTFLFRFQSFEQCKLQSLIIILFRIILKWALEDFLLALLGSIQFFFFNYYSLSQVLCLLY
ncbi:hypothetical protein MKW98_031358 [Papaver atlanticum]|uniref:Uncharacterized protein n=1 Tax=Papaver atlanticum TaxID=357466 RepID=A0AAD4X7X0_9MAGN|nr:hypothetical protein MKW98_031358 [Papaver atlanticum]